MVAQMDFFSSSTRAEIPVAIDDEPSGETLGHKLRPYQEQAVSGAIDALGSNRSTLIVMPTGSGKTRVATEIARRRERDKILFLAHRDELLQQGRARFANDLGELVGLDQAQNFAGDQRIVVASVQTISMERRLERFDPKRFDLVIIDECFPAGTMIDGRKIEDICVGDSVRTVDHVSGKAERGKVVRIFKKQSTNLVRLVYGATETITTKNHPFYVKGKGYIDAGKIVRGDLLCVWKSVYGQTVEEESDSKAMQIEGVQKQAIVDDNGKDEHHSCERENGIKQPYAQGWKPGEDERNIASNRPQAEGSRREWNRIQRSGNSSSKRVGMADASGCGNEYAERVRVSDLLQAGRGELGLEDRDRSRREQPCVPSEESAGREEGEFLAWVRVDSIESIEPSSPGGITVYNFEVEGTHTYFANGALVHNCHHATSPSYRKIIDYFSEAKVIGVTATPDRADEKAMGMVFDSVAFLYEIEDAIRDSYLCDVVCTRINIAGLDLSSCKTTAGDLNQGDLDAVMKVEGVLQGVADATIREARDRKTLVFANSVENAHRLAEIMCRHRKGCAKAVDGKTDIIERRSVLRGHQDGDYQFLINVGIATEGYDDPSIACVAIARPTKSRALYTQMAGRGLRIFQGKEDCIAEGQRVLTDHGLVPIENVTTEMLIWDGCGFFSHDGAILRGEREVIKYAGLEATADHRVWTKEGWKAFGECSSKQIPIAVTEHDGVPVWEVDGNFRSCPQEEWQATPLNGMPGVSRKEIKGYRESETRNSGMPSLRTPATSSTVACQSSVSSEAEVREHEGPQVCGLRRERDSVLFSIANSDGGLDNEEPWYEQEHGNRQDREFRELRAGESSIIDEKTEPSTHAEDDALRASTCISSITSRDQVCGYDAHQPCRNDDIRRDSGEIQPQVIQTQRRVWDILNAGPFHRFTVEGLLVHNCLILDFVGNSGRHKLASALDVLGGKYTDEEQALAEEIVAKNPGKNAREAFDEAQAKIEEEKRKANEAARRSAIKAKAIYTKSTVNPFSVFGIDVTKDRQIENRFGGKVASDKQVECLKKFKIPIEDGLTAGMASKLIGAAIGRRQKNLASFGQMKTLQRYGIDAQAMGFKAAGAVMDAISKNQWKPISFGQLSDILTAHGEKQ